ncbi:unnamed protein product [marine sediment metagenome]|uniref:Uncharacterized protein n=1 Tax=marine sediment metagenome TaxID=412755 RepID=X0SAR9_9ZZZZ
MTTQKEQPKETKDSKKTPLKRMDFGGTLTLNGIKKHKKK